MSLFLVLISFWFLVGVSYFSKKDQLINRNSKEWILDIVGLLLQGAAVPFVAFVISKQFPESQGIWKISFSAAFLLSFVGVDYLYYWNHRLLHTQTLWSFHRVHHSTRQMDVLMTSRNSFWTVLLIVYVWVNSLFIFLLKNPEGFLWGTALGAALDLWRHSGFKTHPTLKKYLGEILILPEDHAWHHSQDQYDVNFGANLKVWDRIHGTYYENSERAPEKIGMNTDANLSQQLLFPWKIK